MHGARVAAGRAHDDGDVAGAWVAPETLDEFDAIETRHIKIDDREIEILISRQTPCRMPILGLDHMVGGAPQARRDKREEDRIVIHDEDPHPVTWY